MSPRKEVSTPSQWEEELAREVEIAANREPQHVPSLSPEQRAKLLAHLVTDEAFRGDGCAQRAVNAIDMFCEQYRERASPEELPNLEPHIEAARTTLYGLDTLWNGAHWHELERPERRQLLRWYGTLVQTKARYDAAKKRGRGQPKKKPREELIRNLYALYPPGTAKKSESSHFMGTVKIVLELVNVVIADVFGVVKKATRSSS